VKGGEEEEATLEPSEDRCIEVRRRFSSRGLPRSTIGSKICEITISSTVGEEWKGGGRSCEEEGRASSPRRPPVHSAERREHGGVKRSIPLESIRRS